MSSHVPLNIDDFYEYYDPDEDLDENRSSPVNTRSVPFSTHSPVQPFSTHSPIQEARSASSTSFRSLRRTPRLQEPPSSRLQTPSSRAPSATFPQQPSPTLTSSEPTPSPEPQHLEELAALSEHPDPHEHPLSEEATTTSAEEAQGFRQIVDQPSYWPRPSTLLSSRTREAVLFALEALRHGKGKDYHELTPDLTEELAEMADLPRGGQPPGTVPASRAHNGGSRAGPVPVSGTHPPSGVRTPTDVMRARRDREARKRAEQEAIQRQQDEEVPNMPRRTQEQPIPEAKAEAMAQKRAALRQEQAESGYPQESFLRSSGTQDPGATSSRRSENVPLSTQTGSNRQRGASVSQAQPRPVASSRYDPQQQSTEGEPTGYVRTRAPRRSSNTPSAANPPPAQPAPQSEPQATQQSGSRSGFPHAFERWETLSSHWEGLTSYWIRRLQENSNELNREPLSQQMSRQITDLSAAGANLFHAVVELQRLRASSERKFQRWFFETRTEQERAREREAELVKQIEDERKQRVDNSSHINAARAERDQRIKAEDLVKEMRRELQISKEEARRAWEELGRREQEERDRTTSLRNGEPTLVGGVQVVPMTQGVSSRQTSSAQRPPTREGPYAGGPGPSTMGGQTESRRGPESVASPEEELREEQEYGYDQPSVSSAQSDPFESNTAGRDPQYYEQQRPSQSAARPTAAGSVPSPSRGYRQTAPNTAEPAFYQQGSSAETSIHQPMQTSNGLTSPVPVPSDPGRSYIPSTAGSEGYGEGEEEYEIDSQGNYRLDQHGQPIVYRSTAGGQGRPISSVPSDDDDDYDVQDQIQREREYRQQYGGPPSTGRTSNPATSTSSSSAGRPTAGTALTPLQRQEQQQRQASGGSYHSAATVSSPQSQGSQSSQQQQPADYSGQGWGGPGATGWESITTRHRHPTRLSDVLEEDERSRRTSPSRQSMISGGGMERGMGR